MAVVNNPTGRLLDLMIKVKTLPDATKTRSAWATILGCDETDTGHLLHSIARLINLVEEAKAATRMHVPGDPRLYLAPFPAIETMLSRLSFESTWNNSKLLITDTVISGLEFGSHHLAFYYPEKSLDNEHLKRLIESVDSLLEECINADIPKELKQLFAHNLNSLRQSLTSYRISGAQGLQEELDRIAGTVLRNKDVLLVAGESPETRDLTSKFFDVIAKVNDSVQIVQTACALAAPLTIVLSMLPKG